MRLVFVGASGFGLRCLQRLIDRAHVDVVGVVTAPELFTISYAPGGVTNVLHADVDSYARRLGLPVSVLQAGTSPSAVYDTVAGWRPDMFLVVGWYHMVPRRWRELAPAYGLHASLLPDYSGGAPLVWAMINGESRTGITLFQLDEGVDTGPIAAQVAEEIRPTDTIASLYARIEERGLELIDEVMPQLAAGRLTLCPQPSSGRRVMPQRSPADGLIDWTQDAAVVDRWVRAQTRPYPGAFTCLDERRLTIWRGRPVETATSGEVGRIGRVAGGGYQVSCGNGALELDEVAFLGATYDADHLSEIFGDGGQQLGQSY